MCQPTDIKWVKNIKREGGTAWAYMEDEALPEFDLHFSIRKKGAAKTARAGDVILLFQRVDKIPGIPAQTYLTHLVAAVDEVIQPSGRPDFPVSRRVRVIARGNKEFSPAVSPAELSFFKPNRGAVHDIGQLNESLAVQEIQNKIWSLFNGLFI
ncbi:hypothetical protein V9K67_24020 [Paraflavisolibacter sp. H34]|uniref:hypothetical protein n=1 Tax=Huijunlia imazamoxiresistens TaxID=3127457 RepID=UPI0030189E5C